MLFRSLYSATLMISVVFMVMLNAFSMDTRETNYQVNGVPISTVTNLADVTYDAVILVTYPATEAVRPVPILEAVINNALQLDNAVSGSPTVLFTDVVAGGRLIVSPTGPFTPYDDIRSIYGAARAGMQRAMSAGARQPILVVRSHPDFPEADLVTLLGAFEELYVPIEIREWFPERRTKLSRLGIYADSLTKPLQSLLTNAVALEVSRAVTRDIAAGDPERMPAKAVADYVINEFAGSRVSVQVVDNITTIEREYPLFAAVNRAAQSVERHQGNIIFLEYEPTGPPDETVILVGKGITYDSGGADVKTGGGMISMSRDKAGAAAVAGFLKACELLRPSIKVIGVMCMARNSIGEEGYVADELILSRSGQTVRVGNTDAEGRMVMGDLLFEMGQRALNEVNPHIYAISTLTGAATRSVGRGFTIILDNHVARENNHAAAFRLSGESVADMVEISTIRREDLRAFRGRGEGDDIYQVANTAPGDRGHQGPAAFMLLVSRLNEGDIPYSHLDIAPSYGPIPERSTASPLLALANHHNLIRY